MNTAQHNCSDESTEPLTTKNSVLLMLKLVIFIAGGVVCGIGGDT
jgi:hypothetical protein